MGVLECVLEYLFVDYIALLHCNIFFVTIKHIFLYIINVMQIIRLVCLHVISFILLRNREVLKNICIIMSQKSL